LQSDVCVWTLIGCESATCDDEQTEGLTNVRAQMRLRPVVLGKQSVTGDRRKCKGRCRYKPGWSRSIGIDDVGMVVGVLRGECLSKPVLLVNSMLLYWLISKKNTFESIDTTLPVNKILLFTKSSYIFKLFIPCTVLNINFIKSA